MDPLQEQVTTLTQKVDTLQHMIEQVNERVSEVLVHSHSRPESPASPVHYPVEAMPKADLSATDTGLFHKDVLEDPAGIDFERSGDEKGFSPEVQIQRLTAQLTAAYNRIAALEEQLLASRPH